MGEDKSIERQVSALEENIEGFRQVLTDHAVRMDDLTEGLGNALVYAICLAVEAPILFKAENTSPNDWLRYVDAISALRSRKSIEEKLISTKNKHYPAIKEAFEAYDLAMIFIKGKETEEDIAVLSENQSTLELVSAVYEITGNKRIVEDSLNKKIAAYEQIRKNEEEFLKAFQITYPDLFQKPIEEIV